MIYRQSDNINIMHNKKNRNLKKKDKVSSRSNTLSKVSSKSNTYITKKICNKEALEDNMNICTCSSIDKLYMENTANKVFIWIGFILIVFLSCGFLILLAPPIQDINTYFGCTCVSKDKNK